MDELSEKYQSELETLKAERSRLLHEAKAEARQITAEANKQIENTIRVIRESQADKEKTLEVRRKMEEFKETLEQDSAGDEAIDRKIEQIRRREQRRAERRNRKQETGSATPAPPPEKPRIVEPGVKVRIKGQDAVGEVVSVSGKRATVGFGQILTTLDAERLEPISNAEYKKAVRNERSAPVPVTNYSTAEIYPADRRARYAGVRSAAGYAGFCRRGDHAGFFRNPDFARQRHRGPQRGDSQLPARGRSGQKRPGRARRTRRGRHYGRQVGFID